jgi:hypothetical protein
MADVAVDVDGLAQLTGHPLLDPGRLHDPDPVADQREGGRLVRRAEPDRPQPRPARLQPADHGVAAPHLGEPAAVDVQRQDPGHLLPHPVGVDFAGHLPYDHLVRLPQAHPGRRLLPITKARCRCPASTPRYAAGENPSRNAALAASENGPAGTSSKVVMVQVYQTAATARISSTGCGFCETYRIVPHTIAAWQQ